jgi:hypothetical protein
MYMSEKDLNDKLAVAECKGVRRARHTLSYVHKQKASVETDPVKKVWHLEEAQLLLDDDKWNVCDL